MKMIFFLAIEGNHRVHLFQFLHFVDEGQRGHSSCLVVTAGLEIGLKGLILGSITATLFLIYILLDYS